MARCSQAPAQLGCGRPNVAARSHQPRHGWTRLGAPTAPPEAVPWSQTHPRMMPRAFQRITGHTFEVHMPGRLVKLMQQLDLPHRETRAHRCVDQLWVRNMIEGFQQMVESVATACQSAVAHSLHATCSQTQRSTPRACAAAGLPHLSLDSFKLGTRLAGTAGAPSLHLRSFFSSRARHDFARCLLLHAQGLVGQACRFCFHSCTSSTLAAMRWFSAEVSRTFDVARIEPSSPEQRQLCVRAWPAPTTRGPDPGCECGSMCLSPSSNSLSIAVLMCWQMCDFLRQDCIS